MKKCLVLNDSAPIPTETLADLDGQLDVVWYQHHHVSIDLPLLLERHQNTQVLITSYMDLGAENLRRLPALELIVTTTTAFEYVDLGCCADHGVIVCNTANYAGNAVAEHAMALLLAVAKKITSASRAGCHDSIGFGDSTEFGVELSGKQTGIVGLGSIGSGVARMASGLGMRVRYTDRGGHRAGHGMESADRVPLEGLLRTSDALILTLPLTDETRAMIGAHEISLMKPGVLLVSISPEDIIDLKALVRYLDVGHIAGAGLDLVGSRPVFLDAPNLVLTSRAGARTPECAERRRRVWRSTVDDYLGGRPLSSRVA